MTGPWTQDNQDTEHSFRGEMEDTPGVELNGSGDERDWILAKIQI